MLITEQVWWRENSDNYWKQVRYCTVSNIFRKQSHSIVEIIELREVSE